MVRLKPGTRPPRVLVVEDHADSRQVLVKLLSEAGFEVQEAADGLQALARWEEFAPEFIWMDINLPQLDGCEATQAIKKRAGGKRDGHRGADRERLRRGPAADRGLRDRRVPGQALP